MQSCMFDQSAYISYLVEEAVNGLDNSNAPSTSTQSQQHIATPSTHTPPYQADFSFPRNTGAPNFPPLSSVSFNPQLTQPPQRLQLYVAPVQQNIPQNPVPVPNPAYPVSFGAVTNYLPQQESQSTVSSPRYQASSFCLNQHIGLDQPTIVNASQINNKIHVQFQFGDNDRFSVQSTNTTESNGPGVNWQNFGSNVSESTAGTVNLNIPTVVQPGNVQTNNNCHSNTPTDIGDFSQFCVSSILRKNCTDVGNTTDANKTALNTENVKHDRHVEEREYFRLFMKKEKEIEKNRIWHGSEWNYNKSEVNHKLTEKVGSLKKGANKVKTVADTQSTLQVNKQGYYEFSHLYSKSYLQHGKKHKTKKDNSKKSDTGRKLKRSVPVKKSRSKVGEVCEKVTLLKLTYQCGDCTQTYDNIEDLKKHIRENHKETNKSCEGSSKSQESENKVIDLTETEETDEVSMARETEEQDIMEVESENTSSDPQSYLCSYCGYDCKSKDESEEHQKIHKDEIDGENREIDCHKEGREYFQMSQKLVECQKERENEKRKNVEERNHKEEEAFAKAKAIEEVPLQKTQSFSQGSKTKKSNDKNKNVSNLRLERLQQLEENRILPKRRAATQAKNTLMNPSKGKQKRIRDTRNLNKEDTMLMEMFGIIPSKVCLSRVQESENLESQIVNSSSDDLGQEKRIEIERNLEGGEKQVMENNTVENNHSDVVMNISNSENDTPIVNNFGDDLVHEKSGTNGKKEENMEGKEIQIARNNEVAKNNWSKIINMSNSENKVNAKENMFDDKAFSDDDSDIEIVEPPMTLIVLDDEDEEADTKKESPKKSDKEIMKSFGLKDVTVNIEKTEKSKVKESPGKEKSRSDTELMEKFGIKDLSVSLTSTPTKVKRKRPGPKSKTQTGSRQTRGSKSTGNAAVKNIEEMSPNEIEKLLYECGMGISVPVQSQNTSDNGKESNDKAKRTPSPVPSTSKGHGHLRRKRTARKSTKDSALFKEYKLKDSKVIIRNLSRIDISLLRNPNSPFGKSDWLKHKFDSDTESDFEFDIPTPPLLEDFVENTGPSGGERIEQNVLSSRTGPPVKTGRKSPVKQKDLKAMKKFGISDSVVVIDSQKKNENSKLDIGKKKTLSDEELRKKFGIPNTMVVINTSEKTADSCKKESSDKKEAEKTSSYINFADFKAALDSARKNVLNRMKTDEDYTKKEMEAEKDSPRKTRRSAENFEDKVVQSPKRQKVDVKGKLNESMDTENDSPRKTRRRADGNEEKVVQSPKRQKVEVAGKLNESMDTENDSPRKKRRRVDDNEEKVVQPLKRQEVEIKRKLNKNLEQKDNKKRRNEKETYTKPNRIKTSRMDAKQLVKVLPNKLKTLTVDLHKLKLNEALKTYKAKAVSRAIEARHKKNRSLREFSKGGNEKSDINSKETHSLSQKKPRNEKPNILSEKSVKRKGIGVKEKQKCMKELKFERKIQIVKTARYKRAVPDTMPKDEIVKTCSLKQLTKGLPVVKVTVPCLTSEEILRLSQNIEKSVVSVKESKSELTSSEVANQILDEIIDGICCAEELPDETVHQLDGVSDICGSNPVTTGRESGESDVSDNSKKSVPSDSEGVKSVQESSNKQESTRNIKKENLNVISTDESESDLSLISVTLENKENENNTTAPYCENTDLSDENKSTDHENDNEVSDVEKKTVSEIDVIPLGKSKFYDEDVEENSLDEVDGEIVDGTEMSLEDDEENVQNTFSGEQIEDSCEIKTKHEDISLAEEGVNNEVKHFYGSKENDDIIVLKTSPQKLMKTSKIVECINNDTSDDGSAEKENISEKNIEKELNDTDMTNTLKSYVEVEINDSEDNSTNSLKQKQVLSAIIDSESGSLIGDVYSVDESAGSSSEGDHDKKLHKRGKNSSDGQIENFSRASRSRSTTPDDVIESLTES